MLFVMTLIFCVAYDILIVTKRYGRVQTLLIDDDEDQEKSCER